MRDDARYVGVADHNIARRVSYSCGSVTKPWLDRPVTATSARFLLPHLRPGMRLLDTLVAEAYNRRVSRTDDSAPPGGPGRGPR